MILMLLKVALLSAILMFGGVAGFFFMLFGSVRIFDFMYSLFFKD